jgi:hypothetical protein
VNSYVLNWYINNTEFVDIFTLVHNLYLWIYISQHCFVAHRNITNILCNRIIKFSLPWLREWVTERTPPATYPALGRPRFSFRLLLSSSRLPYRNKINTLEMQVLGTEWLAWYFIKVCVCPSFLLPYCWSLLSPGNYYHISWNSQWNSTLQDAL